MFEPLIKRSFLLFKHFGCRTIGEFVDYIDDLSLTDPESLTDFLRKTEIEIEPMRGIDDPMRFVAIVLFGIFVRYEKYDKIFKLYVSYVLLVGKVIYEDSLFEENLKEAFSSFLKNKQDTILRRAEILLSDMMMLTQEEREKTGNYLKEYTNGKRLREIMSTIEEKNMTNMDHPLVQLKDMGYGADCFISVSTPAGSTKEYPCHRLILASFSEFFKTQFENEERFRSEGGNRFSIEVSEHEFGIMDFFLSLPYYGIHYHPFAMTRGELFNIFGGKTDDEIAVLFGLCDRFSVVSRMTDYIYKHISNLKISTQLYILSALPFSKERISKLASYSKSSREEFLNELEDADLDEQMSAIVCQYSLHLPKANKISKEKPAPKPPGPSPPSTQPPSTNNQMMSSMIGEVMSNPGMMEGVMSMMQNPSVLQAIGPLMGLAPQTPAPPPISSFDNIQPRTFPENAPRIIPILRPQEELLRGSGEDDNDYVDAILEKALSSQPDNNSEEKSD